MQKEGLPVFILKIFLLFWGEKLSFNWLFWLFEDVIKKDRWHLLETGKE